ncbi:hypothetical protein GCM10028827_29310 [Mucilaginibacter myungsuensis]
MLLTILQDSLFSQFHATSFYLSESLLFTSFWWIFLPLLYAQFLLAQNVEVKSWSFILMIILPMVLHFLTFPSLVWLVSKLFFENTFRFQMTLRYALSSYLHIVLMIYTIPVIVLKYINARKTEDKAASPEHPAEQEYLRSISVTDGNKKLSINTADIQYFSANSPYINIHTVQKQYLYNDTLRSIGVQLSPDFVRIHKSTIVNINYVDHYTSRLNGDHDLTLKDGTQLRVSRNFVATFKERLQGGHRVAVV